MSNFREMTPQRLPPVTVRKKFKLLKYEHNRYHIIKQVIWRFRKYKLFCEIYKICENTSKTDFAKFLKVFIKSGNLNIVIESNYIFEISRLYASKLYIIGLFQSRSATARFCFKQRLWLIAST